MQLSARNVLPGEVAGVGEGVTNDAVEGLALKQGDQAYAAVMAPDVVAGKD